MLSPPVAVDQWTRRRDSRVTATPGSQPAARVHISGALLRVVFIVALIIGIGRVSVPQSASFLTLFDTPADLIRVVLGLVACIWTAIQVVAVPRDPNAFRTWFYIGLGAVPFLIICIIGTW
jgi:hypothetical protein